jgi:hypothetical protein
MPKPNFIQRFKMRQAQKQSQKKINDFAALYKIKPGLTPNQIKKEILKLPNEKQRRIALIKLEFLNK